MAMAMAACSSRQRLSEVNPDGANYFMEKLLFQIYDHFDEQDLIDVTFKLSNPSASVTAHRLILSAASPYFKQLFKSDAGFCPLIEITDIASDTFERLITFCYTGKTLVTIDNVEEMLKAALVLQLEDAVSNCVDFLIEHMGDLTYERAYVLESETQCALLSEKILEYELENFMSIMQSTNFLNFGETKLKTILENNNLNIPSENVAFEAVKRWYEHNASARKPLLPDIIRCLRLTQLETNFILTEIHTLPGCQVVALEALSWANCPSSRTSLSLKFTNPRRGRGTQFFALNIEEGESRTIFQYNKTEDLWQKWVDIEMDVLYFRAVFLDDSLILIGGCRDWKLTNEVSSWNFKTQTMQRLPPMNQPRCRHCVVVLNDKIYAIGGEGANEEILKSVEVYSVSNGWQAVASMITARCRVNAVVLNEKIYVLGGENRSKLKSVECYDPTINCWTPCADMNEVHSNPGATVHNGQIFVVGGWKGTSTPTVERYDAQRNEWTKICSLSMGIQYPGCISFDNQVWAVAGYNNGVFQDCVSVYDEQNDKWIDKTPIPLAGQYYCFTVPKALL